MIRINEFLPDAECDYSGKSGEAVNITSDDRSIENAVISMAELTKQLRFRYRQMQRKNGGNGAAAVATPIDDI